MIINEKLIIDIFNLKVKIKDKDKDKISKYQDLIPMYDIYTQEIYPINKQNIHYRLIETDYRFISNEIHDWLTNLYKKNKKNKELCKKFKRNLDIIKNYNIDILIDTSYKTLYEYSPKLGLLVSICKRKSFDPYIKHLKPYYTKLELVKLGQNMKLLKEIEIENLLNQDIHYKICKKVSSNDVSFKEIKEHTQHIIDNDIISYITFYSFYGSFLYNKYLRENKSFNSFLYNGMNSILKSIGSSPKLENNYYLYRFIWDDSFLQDLKIGDEFIDPGFLSTTRDPFYSPGINGNFGLTLLKINIPANVKGLMIENFSLFPNEQEFLLPPDCKLKLISKDNKFKYFHTNQAFEDIISKKFEFEYINNLKLNEIKVKDNFKVIENLKTYEIHGNDRINMFKNFISESNQIKFTINNKTYLVICMFFDSTEQSSYSKLYYNKIKDGLLISIYENSYPYLNIECGKEMVINYINQFYFYKNNKNELNSELVDIILEFGRIFYYKDAKIFHNFRNFSEFNKDIFSYMNFYNHTIYNYIKNKTKYLDFPFIKANWYKIDEIINMQFSKELKNKYKLQSNKISDAIIEIIENNSIIYDKFISELSTEYKINKDTYLIFEIYEKLNNQNRIENFRSNIGYDEDESLGDDFKLIFRQPLRRF